MHTLLDRPTRTLALRATAALALFATHPPLAQLPATVPEGKVRMYKLTSPEFDVYLNNLTWNSQQFMSRLYTRMQVYSPYFDSHTGWYDRGWAYKDVYAIKPEWPIFQEHPEWILRDANGQMLYIDWGCGGGTCPQFAADFGNPAFRAWWIEEAQALLNLGYRGLWMDDVNMDWRIGNGAGQHVTPVDPRTGSLMTLADWRRYMADFVIEVRHALPQAELAHNCVWYAAPQGHEQLERQLQAADYINLERGFNDAGLTGGTGQWSLHAFMGFIDYLHGMDLPIVMMDYAPGVAQREYGLCGYLLMNTGRDLVSTDHQEWSSPWGNWWRPYGMTLGAALGGRYTWNGLVRRDFEDGLVLVAPPGTPAAWYTLSSPMRDLTGQLVSGVWLSGADGRILLNP